MTRKTPTEDELGLGPTEDELATVSAPEPDVDDPADPPEVAAKTEPEPTPAKADEQPRMVDVRALQEARAEAREARENARILEQRWNDFLAAQRKPKAEEPAIPNGDDDPVNAVKWTQQQVIEMRREAEQREREQQEAHKRQQEQSRLLSDAGAEFQQASQTDPTVAKAYEALLASFQREAAVYRMTPQQLQAHIQQTEIQHIEYARRNRIPLADYIKGLAGARGWQPEAATTPAPKKTDVAALAAAQQRHQSLSDAPGGDAPAPLDAKALAKMSDKEFKAWLSKKGNEAKFDEIMGA